MNKYTVFSHKRGSLKPKDRYKPVTVLAMTRKSAINKFSKKRPNATVIGVNRHPKHPTLSRDGGIVYD